MPEISIWFPIENIQKNQIGRFCKKETVRCFTFGRGHAMITLKEALLKKIKQTGQ